MGLSWASPLTLWQALYGHVFYHGLPRVLTGCRVLPHGKWHDVTSQRPPETHTARCPFLWLKTPPFATDKKTWLSHKACDIRHSTRLVPVESLATKNGPYGMF